MAASSPILDDDFDPADGFPDDPTLCVECDLVHPDTLSKPPFAWRCMAAPAPLWGGFVNPLYTPDPPYQRCQDLNGGTCPHWTPKRTPNV
jgi:hypothetical protein